MREKLIQIQQLYDRDELFLFEAGDYANECLLGLKRYEEFLANTHTKISDHSMSLMYSLRLSVQKQIGIDANPLDIYCLQYPTKSNVIQSNPEIFEKKVIEVFNNYAIKYGSWFKLIEDRFNNKITPMDYQILEIYQFPCKRHRPLLDLKVYNYYVLGIGKDGLNAELKRLTTKAENLVRSEIGLSKIDVAWTMETFLFEYIKKKEFPDTEVIQHGKPKWLGNQHYDIWIPEWKIAVEFHGMQHFEPIVKWGGENALTKMKELDLRKKNLSIQQGVDLFIITIEDNQMDLIKKIRDIIEEKSL